MAGEAEDNWRFCGGEGTPAPRRKTLNPCREVEEFVGAVASSVTTNRPPCRCPVTSISDPGVSPSATRGEGILILHPGVTGAWSLFSRSRSMTSRFRHGQEHAPHAIGRQGKDVIATGPGDGFVFSNDEIEAQGDRMDASPRHPSSMGMR
jgi:hypothetical protein